MKSLRRIVVGAAAAALVAGACGGANATPTQTVAPTAAPTATPRPVAITWWHITCGDPGMSVWQDAADAYTAAHPNVKISIRLICSESLKSTLDSGMKSGTGPDLFQSWGGAMMDQQARDGYLQDITAAVSSWASEINTGAMKVYQYDGKQYGIPWDMSMIGFWYNKDILARAGYSTFPATWDDLLTAIGKIKALGVSPYALAGKDEWPGMHLWTYLVLRIGGADALTQMIQTGNWNTDACQAGGAQVQRLVALRPFQPGYMSAAYDSEAAAMGNGQAAMELMGQWAPGVEISNSTSGKGIGDRLGWAPFPSVTGGKGAATDGVGGGNGIAVGKNAPPEAIDFLHYLNSKAVANQINLANMGLSTTNGTEGTVTDANLRAVLADRARATFIQLYLDQATRSDVGKAINHATSGLFAGTATPDKVCADISAAAKNASSG